MRSRITKTATGKSLQNRRKRITTNSAPTDAQVAYRKRRKVLTDYYNHERELERYKP